MEEHFNENYMESDKYTKAIFRGTIEKFDVSNLTSTPKDFVINRKLEIHRKTKDDKIIVKINKSLTGITILSNFTVNANDYDIAIPNIVKSKVSNKINIKIDSNLK